MKRVVFSLSFFFLLFTLSHAFHPETLDLTQVSNHHHHKQHHHHHLPSSDGSDSSKILLPMEDSSSVLDNTQSYVVEYKEAVSEPEIIPEDSNPFELKNRHSFPVYRFNPIRCRQIHRFMRHPRRFGGVNELGFDPVLTYVLQNRDVARKFPEVERAIRMFDQYHMGPLHHLNHHHDHDHQRVEKIKEEDDDEERENEVEKNRKEKGEKKKRKEKDAHEEEDEDKEKNTLKKIRKFLNYF